MTEAKLTWSLWQGLLNSFAWAFTRRGFHRFAEWITALALNVEEHTITQSVLALDQPADWEALASFAEYGSWHEHRVTRTLTRLIATAPGQTWHGYLCRPSTTRRSIAPAPMFGGRVRSTNTPPAAPIAPLPSAPTIG